MGLFSRMWTSSANALDNRFHWDRMPRPLGIFTLAGLRNLYREKNLYDTRTTSPTSEGVNKQERPENINIRTLDGSYNDLTNPAMGSIGSRFGRNVPVERLTPIRNPPSWSRIRGSSAASC